MTQTPSDKTSMTEWNAAKILSELFGKDVLTDKDWESLAQYPPKGYDSNGTKADIRPSVFEQLQAERQKAAQSGDNNDLYPNEAIDSARNLLFSIIRAKFSDPSVVDKVLARFDDPSIADKIDVMRNTLAAYQRMMEKHHSLLLSERMEKSSFIETNKLTGQPSKLEKLKKFRDIAAGFPYAGNYDKLINAEIQLIKDPMYPAFLRVDDLPPHSETEKDSITAGIEKIKVAASGLIDVLNGSNSLEHNVEYLDNKHITFAGSGAIPATGILLHLETGARINLIDMDEEAITLSRRLIKNLEEIGVVEKGAINIIHGNVKELYYQKNPDQNLDALHTGKEVNGCITDIDKKTTGFLSKRSKNRNGQVTAADDFHYEAKYSLPDRNTPYAISFIGYKQAVDDNGESYLLTHQIYYDKDEGWKRSKDRRLVPTDVLSFAAMIPEKDRLDTMNRVLEQVTLPEAIVMRTVNKDLNQILYPRTNSNVFSSLRAPFYGEVDIKDTTNNIEVYYPLIHRALRNHYPEDRKQLFTGDQTGDIGEYLDKITQAINKTTTKLGRVKKLMENKELSDIHTLIGSDLFGQERDISR